MAIVDTNCDPDDVDYVIPGNDDAIRAVKLIASTMANAIIEGRQGEETAEEAAEEKAARTRPPRRTPDHCRRCRLTESIRERIGIYGIHSEGCAGPARKDGRGHDGCKKALTEADGDMEKAADILREKGLAAQVKKAGRIAAEGAVYAAVCDKCRVGVVVEINAETDFCRQERQVPGVYQGRCRCDHEEESRRCGGADGAGV